MAVVIWIRVSAKVTSQFVCRSVGFIPGLFGCCLPFKLLCLHISCFLRLLLLKIAHSHSPSFHKTHSHSVLCISRTLPLAIFNNPNSLSLINRILSSFLSYHLTLSKSISHYCLWHFTKSYSNCVANLPTIAVFLYQKKSLYHFSLFLWRLITVRCLWELLYLWSFQQLSHKCCFCSIS